MNARVPAEVFAPGEFLKEELDIRGWTQQELSEILGRPPRLISEIVSGKRAITPETAQGLGEAFGTGGEYWLNLESQYALSKVRVESDAVKRRASLHERFPIREMIKRGWLTQTMNVGILEKQVFEFFGVTSANDDIGLLHAAKKSSSYEDGPSMLQLAWLLRCKELAASQIVSPYTESKLRQALPRFRALLTAPEEVRHTPRLLRECGVRFVMVEALPGSKIDGACCWLDETKPVIAMSLRFDRIDNFWFVFRHEIEHVLRGDGKDAPAVDQELEKHDLSGSPAELAANSAAADFSVPLGELDDFIARVSPYFSEPKVCGFAQRLGVHPGIAVGQLQRRLGRHDFLRRHQVKVRAFLTTSGDVDGWDALSRV